MYELKEGEYLTDRGLYHGAVDSEPITPDVWDNKVQEGQTSKAIGVGLDGNPYKKYTGSWNAWNEGWDQ